MTDLPTIGWREWVELPDIGSGKIKAKIDTGARSSALHAAEIAEFEEGGLKQVRFRLYPEQREMETTWEAVAPIVDYREIRSSNGEVTLRPVILTNLTALGASFPIELTLADRSQMGFRMLIGREALRGRFLVDSGRSFLGGRRKRKKRPRNLDQ